jgi:hypothetical protein
MYPRTIEPQTYAFEPLEARMLLSQAPAGVSGPLPVAHALGTSRLPVETYSAADSYWAAGREIQLLRVAHELVLHIGHEYQETRDSHLFRGAKMVPVPVFR